MEPIQRVRTVLALIIAATLIVWLTAEIPLWLGSSATRQLGDAVMQGTGLLSIVLMSASLTLAARPRIVEGWMDGLDKMYRLHKWLGIANLIVAAIHWQAYGSSDLTSRAPNPQLACRPMLRAAGRDLSSHSTIWPWLFVPTYLFLIFHSVILLEVGSWVSLLGPLLALVMATGACLGIVCFRVVDDRAMGEIIGLTRHEAVSSLELEVQLDSRWSGHKAGQFAFLTIDPAGIPSA